MKISEKGQKGFIKCVSPGQSLHYIQANQTHICSELHSFICFYDKEENLSNWFWFFFQVLQFFDYIST